MNQPKGAAEVLQRRAQALAQTVDQVDVRSPVGLIEVGIDTLSLAIDSNLVQETFRFQASQLTPLPGCAPQVAGIVSVNGELVPLVLVTVLFGRPVPNLTGQGTVVVVKVRHSLYGLYVDTLKGVRILDRSDLLFPTRNQVRPWVNSITTDGSLYLNLDTMLEDENLGFTDQGGSV